MSSETWTIPIGVHDVYYDCTMFAKTDVIENVPGEITNLTMTPISWNLRKYRNNNRYKKLQNMN